MLAMQLRAVLACALLSGCVAGRLPLQTSPRELLRYDAATEGLAVGSIAIAIADEDETAQPLLLRHGPATSTAARAEYRFTIVPETSGAKSRFFMHVDPKRESGFVARMPAGSYRFGKISALGVWDAALDGPRFSVTVGEATYVGRFVLLLPARLGNRRASLLAVTDAAWAAPYPPTASRGLPREAKTELAQPPLTQAIWGIGSAARGEAPASGTCFAVSPDGLVLTSAHLVAGARALHLRFEGGLETAAHVVASHPAHDLAVLQADMPTPHFASLAPSGTLGVGQIVIALGYPGVSQPGSAPTLAHGALSGVTGPGGNESFIQMSFPMPPGSAGSPLFFASGEVVGMVAETAAAEPFFDTTAALPSVFALKADEAAALFDPPPRQLRVWKRSEAIEKVRAALCRIEVER